MTAQIFIYQTQINFVAPSTGDYLVLGAPRMGKSTFLHRLQDDEKKQGNEVLFVRGKDTERAREQVLAYLQSPSGVLLVDDLHWMFNRHIEDGLCNRQRHDDEKAKHRIVATSAKPVRALDASLSVGMGYSDPASRDTTMRIEDSRGLMTFHQLWLNPWPEGWRERNAGLLQQLDPCISEKDFCDISGGHPALMNELLVRCEELALAARRLEAAGQTTPEVTTTGLENFLIENHSELVTAALEWVRTLVAPSAIDELLNHSRERDLSRVVELPQALELKKAGLVITENGLARIPCEAIRRWLFDLRLLDRDEREPERSHQEAHRSGVSLLTEPGGFAGQLVWTENGRPREIPLRPSEWRVMQRLSDSSGELVTVEQLAGKGEQKETAVRSALQRIQDKLRVAGISNVLVNVRRKGYVFKPSNGDG